MPGKARKPWHSSSLFLWKAIFRGGLWTSFEKLSQGTVSLYRRWFIKGDVRVWLSRCWAAHPHLCWAVCDRPWWRGCWLQLSVPRTPGDSHLGAAENWVFVVDGWVRFCIWSWCQNDESFGGCRVNVFCTWEGHKWGVPEKTIMGWTVPPPKKKYCWHPNP